MGEVVYLVARRQSLLGDLLLPRQHMLNLVKSQTNSVHMISGDYDRVLTFFWYCLSLSRCSLRLAGTEGTRSVSFGLLLGLPRRAQREVTHSRMALS